MKKRFPALILAAALAVNVLLSACSGESKTPPADEPESAGIASSVAGETEPATSAAELSAADSGEEETQAHEPQSVRIDADGGLRMRGGPGTDYDIIKIIPNNAYAGTAESEETHPDWIYVSYDGESGWVSKEFVVYEEKPKSAAAPNWAQIYLDYLNGFNLIRHSEYCEFDWCTDDWWNFEERGNESHVGIFRIEFKRLPDYDYPVMVSFIGPPHAGGVERVNLVENGKVINVYRDDEKRGNLLYKETEFGASPKGESVVIFDYRDNENFLDVLEWLKSQI